MGDDLTKQDLDNSMKQFGELVKAQSKAGTLEAINTHEKECHEKNKELFVTEKVCAERRSECRKGVYKRMNSISNGKPKQSDPSDAEDEPSIKITFGNHIKQHKATYTVSLIAIAEFLFGVGYFIFTRFQ
jgi:hypothetical protein